jgi:hypothetical protein
MPLMNPLLKIKLVILSLIFPFSFSIAGFLIGWYIHNATFTIIFSITGFVLGILLDFICNSHKLFTLALFYAPIPLSIFILSWWIADIFTSTNYSLLIGLFGFGIGYWLNYELVLPYQFFKIKKRILATVYVVFSVSCLGFFMGVPFFNILLGVLAGNYLSIRIMENFRRKAYVEKSFRQGALFTAAILFLMVFFSGLNALTDLQSSMQLVEQLLNTSLSTVQFYWLLAIGGVNLVIIQYFITLFTANTMFEYWMHKKLQS